MSSQDAIVLRDAALATQIVAVAICVLGVGVRAIPPAAIVAVWIYCLVWMVVLDILKLAFHRIVAARDRGNLLFTNAIRKHYITTLRFAVRVSKWVVPHLLVAQNVEFRI
jgi:hypothetical protein